eukprot:scaffold2744_cov64-Phaeocystis_antarctica.AAC.2
MVESRLPTFQCRCTNALMLPGMFLSHGYSLKASARRTTSSAKWTHPLVGAVTRSISSARERRRMSARRAVSAGQKGDVSRARPSA